MLSITTCLRLLLNINFSGVIVILAYTPTITFRFTLWLLSVRIQL